MRGSTFGGGRRCAACGECRVVQAATTARPDRTEPTATDEGPTNGALIPSDPADDDDDDPTRPTDCPLSDVPRRRRLPASLGPATVVVVVAGARRRRVRSGVLAARALPSLSLARSQTPSSSAPTRPPTRPDPTHLATQASQAKPRKGVPSQLHLARPSCPRPRSSAQRLLAAAAAAAAAVVVGSEDPGHLGLDVDVLGPDVRVGPGMCVAQSHQQHIRPSVRKESGSWEKRGGGGRVRRGAGRRAGERQGEAKEGGGREGKGKGLSWRGREDGHPPSDPLDGQPLDPPTAPPSHPGAFYRAGNSKREALGREARRGAKPSGRAREPKGERERERGDRGGKKGGKGKGRGGRDVRERIGIAVLQAEEERPEVGERLEQARKGRSAVLDVGRAGAGKGGWVGDG